MLLKDKTSDTGLETSQSLLHMMLRIGLKKTWILTSERKRLCLRLRIEELELEECRVLIHPTKALGTI